MIPSACSSLFPRTHFAGCCVPTFPVPDNVSPRESIRAEAFSTSQVIPVVHGPLLREEPYVGTLIWELGLWAQPTWWDWDLGLGTWEEGGDGLGIGVAFSMVCRSSLGMFFFLGLGGLSEA